MPNGVGERDVIGMALAGSFADGKPDLYSDLDIRVVLVDGSFERVFERREELARDSGPLVAAFTGEHVGEPQLLITLYQNLVHVDYLFTEIAQAAEKNEGRRTFILWQRDDQLSNALSRPYVASRVKDLTYLEARMWTWTWYIQSKVLRGELWEAVSALNFVRDTVLFRLLAMSQESRYRGARFAEELQGEHAEEGRTYPRGAFRGVVARRASHHRPALPGPGRPLARTLWSPSRGVCSGDGAAGPGGGIVVAAE
jgi:hypothetical protein